MAITEPTADEVRVIISTNMTDAQIDAIVDDAVLLVEDCIEDLSAARQTAIVKYVTAHLIMTIQSGQSGVSDGEAGGLIQQESLGDASVTYTRPTLEAGGLKSTMYGLQAIALDPDGCLVTLGAKKGLFRVL